MVEHRNVRMDLMGSKEVAEYLKRSDMVILPVGCFEMHGPRIPLNCDTFTAWAASILLGEKWDCLVLPPICYTFPGASGPWPGTVDISPGATQEYIKAIAQALLKNGFRRVILCGFHAPLAPIFQFVIRSIHQETGEVVMALRPRIMPNELMQQELGYGGGEDIMVLAAMKILGLHGAYDPAMHVDKPSEMPLETLVELDRCGAALPWTFSADHQHTGIRTGLRLEHADKAVAIMKQCVDQIGDLPALFAKYQQQMRELNESRPWSEDAVWSE